MQHSASVALIAEDEAHEAFVRALVRRLATEAQVYIALSTVTGRGGSAVAISGLEAYQRALRRTTSIPALLIVAIDSNCKGWNATQALIKAKIDDGLFTNVAVASPDPHVEKWYLADPVGLQKHFGTLPKAPKDKCVRGIYKHALIDYLVASGNMVTIGGAEFADEIVGAMDLYRAGKNDAALKAFVDSIRNCFKAL